MNFKFVFLILFFCLVKVSAQEETKVYLYKGNIDGNKPVTLYLRQEISGCPTISYSGIYKYNHVSNWLFLEISDDGKNQFVMVESGITGVLMMMIIGNTLQGKWISPDAKKQLNVFLKEIPMTAKETQSYENQYEQLNYELNDC